MKYFLNLVKWILILVVKFYQGAISPYLGQNCRYKPSCSHYMIEAITVWGPFRGLWLGIRRFSKCHPWGGSGFDPVPKKDIS